jgi:hypothetical protein
VGAGDRSRVEVLFALPTFAENANGNAKSAHSAQNDDVPLGCRARTKGVSAAIAHVVNRVPRRTGHGMPCPYEGERVWGASTGKQKRAGETPALRENGARLKAAATTAKPKATGRR